MREYGRIHVSFWTSDTIRALGDDGRTLAAYLLTCEHNTIIGAFRLPAAYACDDLGWTLERFKKGFKTLEEHGFAVYCRTSKWVCILKYLEWNPAENPNQQKAITKALNALPNTCFTEGLRNGSVTLTKQGTGEGEGTGAGEERAAVAFQIIVEQYHANLPNCARVEVLTDKRKTAIRNAETNAKRVCKAKGWEYGPDFWRDFFAECAKDPYYRGDLPNPKNPDWKQNLDVLLRDEHFAKIMDKALAGLQP